MFRATAILVMILFITLPGRAFSQNTQTVNLLVTLKLTDPSASIGTRDVYAGLWDSRRMEWSVHHGTMPAGVPFLFTEFRPPGAIDNPMEGEMYVIEEALRPSATGTINLPVSARIGAPSGGPTPESIEKAIALFTEHCRTIVRSDASGSPEQRAARLRQLADQIARLQRQVRALDILKDANQQDSPEGRMRTRLKVLRDQLQVIELDVASRRARQEALQIGMRRQEADLQNRQQADPILEQLKSIVAARTRELDFTKARQAGGGPIFPEDIARAEAQVAEARIRMLERESAISRTGKGELLDRMADESAMLAVDVTELEIKRQLIERQLNAFNPSAIDAGKIDEILRDNPELRTDSSVAAFKAAQDELNKALRERFVLLVEDLTVKRAE